MACAFNTNVCVCVFSKMGSSGSVFLKVTPSPKRELMTYVIMTYELMAKKLRVGRGSELPRLLHLLSVMSRTRLLGVKDVTILQSNQP